MCYAEVPSSLLHRLVKRRNRYTELCHTLGRKQRGIKTKTLCIHDYCILSCMLYGSHLVTV